MSQVCVFCKGAKVEPGHDDCVWCDNTGVLEIGPKATEVVEPDARALAEECNRLRKERDALQERLNETDSDNDVLIEALRHMTCDYRTAIVNGHERITFLGGDCDSVEKMLADNPNYKKARSILEGKP